MLSGKAVPVSVGIPTEEGTGLSLGNINVRNRLPIGPICVPPATNVTFDVYCNDIGGDTVDLANTIVTVAINGGAPETAYTGGAFVGVYLASSSVVDNSAGVENIQSFELDRTPDFPASATFVVRVQSQTTGGVFTVDDSWAFCTYASTPPYIDNRVPASGATAVDPVGLTIDFDFLDVDDAVQQSTVVIKVDYTVGDGTAYETVYTGGGFVNGWTGTLTPSGFDITCTLTPPVTIGFSQLVAVQGEAEDAFGNIVPLNAGPAPFTFPNGEVNPWQFETGINPGPIPATNLVQKDGGYEITITMAFDDTYLRTRWKVLINGIEAYSGRPGQKNVVFAEPTEVDGLDPELYKDLSFVTMPLDTGVYDVEIINIDERPAGGNFGQTFSSYLTYVPHDFRSRTLNLRIQLHPDWDLGYREIDDEEFPQS